MQFALLSVYEKRGLEDFARGLLELNWKLLATGGTHRFLRERGLPVIPLEEWTGFAELLGGRVKSLHPRVFSAILARSSEDLHRIGIARIGLVAVNFYPYEAMSHLSPEERLEFIDIGGPSLLRAAAKNHSVVIPLCDPDDYSWVLERLRNGGLSAAERRRLAAKAFTQTAAYDAAIAGSLQEDAFPEFLLLSGRRAYAPRYGENPHQGAQFYTVDGKLPFRLLQGKQFSYNNFLDLDALCRFLLPFRDGMPFCVIVKHGIPTSAAHADSAAAAFERAWDANPEPAFGGIVGFNCPVDEACAEQLRRPFLEVIFAPSFTDDARRLLEKKKNLRLVEGSISVARHEIRSAAGGWLLQEADQVEQHEQNWQLLAGPEPSEALQRDLWFGWRLIAGIRSNAAIVVREQCVVGVGAGQTSRIAAVRQALQQAGDRARGAVLVSEAFFPFPDSVEAAHEAGIRAILVPGGSRNDEAVIERARALGLTLLFAPRRHFRH